MHPFSALEGRDTDERAYLLLLRLRVCTGIGLCVTYHCCESGTARPLELRIQVICDADGPGGARAVRGCPTVAYPYSLGRRFVDVSEFDAGDVHEGGKLLPRDLQDLLRRGYTGELIGYVREKGKVGLAALAVRDVLNYDRDPATIWSPDPEDKQVVAPLSRSDPPFHALAFPGGGHAAKRSYQ